MKKSYIYMIIMLSYCVCYNIIQHGAEKTFFIGLIAAVAGIILMNMSFQSGLRLYPDEPDYFDAYFTDTEET